MPRVTLQAVGEKASRDPQFWRALRQDADAALAAAGMELSPADTRTLKAGLAQNLLQLDLDAFMREFHRLETQFPLTWPIWTWDTWRTWPPSTTRRSNPRPPARNRVTKQARKKR